MSYKIHPRTNYPTDGKFLQLIDLDIPFVITKGEDFLPTKRHLWAIYVYSHETGTAFYDFFRETCTDKEYVTFCFKTPEKAYDYAKKLYVKWLQQELLRLK